MSDWESLYCDKHPDRLALERCEVCGRPLCAYCLYYTEDGQRLCQRHAEQARQNGIRVEEPGAYAEQLVGAQAGMTRKDKRRPVDDGSLYHGNATDLAGFVGLLIMLVTLGSMCGAMTCLPIAGLLLAGFLLSLAAVINAGQAFDPRRTRRLGLVGLLVSGIWVAALAACVLFVILPLNTGTVITSGPIVVPPGSLATVLPVPSNSATPSPTVSPESSTTPATLTPGAIVSPSPP